MKRLAERRAIHAERRAERIRQRAELAEARRKAALRRRWRRRIYFALFVAIIVAVPVMWVVTHDDSPPAFPTPNTIDECGNFKRGCGGIGDR
jgi:hypothetical protein